MQTRSRRQLLALVAAMVLAGCGGDDGEVGASGDAPADDTGAVATSPDDAATGTTDEEGTAATTVATADSAYGTILVDGEGMTLYAFLPDQQGEPTCTDDCATTWPLFEGPAGAGSGVDESLLGTAEHPSGTTMATYGGWPLYYFASDQAPGDVNGQGLGDNWYVLGADGEPIQEAAADANASDTSGRSDY